ncbi:MAG: hypothetical protein N3E38_01070 [Candidatus Aenigmarchaeota archaeon]|nr:hypothetical protein [Candidatus Aenigmarchaeota archaeon]
MATISLFKFEESLPKQQIVNLIDGKKENGFWFRAKQSRFRESEIEIDVWYEEDIEIGMNRVFSTDAVEIVQYLKENGKEKIVRKIYCFLDVEKKTLEIYRGYDGLTEKIKQQLEKMLATKFMAFSLSSNALIKLVNEHSSELKQVMFKYLHGLWYSIIRGRHLEKNEKYISYLREKPESLRVVSIVPKIKYMSPKEYLVTVNGDKGTIKFAEGLFKWRPRFEVRQIIDIISLLG